MVSQRQEKNFLSEGFLDSLSTLNMIEIIEEPDPLVSFFLLSFSDLSIIDSACPSMIIIPAGFFANFPFLRNFFATSILAS